MNWNDPILFDFYSGNLPRYQQRPGTVNPDAIRAYMMGLPGRAPKQAPKSVPKGLTQIPAQDQFYQNQLQKYGRTREDIARAQQEAALPFLLATGAMGAAAAAPLLATAAPAIGAGLSYAPVASAPAATLGNLLTSAGTAAAITNLPNTGRSVKKAFRTGELSDIGQATMNVGLTGLDLLPVYGPLGKQLSNFAQHPLVSTLPYVLTRNLISRNAIPQYAGAVGISAINRLSPILSTNPITKGLYKKAAERIASISLGQSRELPQIAKALFTNKPGTYTGMVGSSSASGYLPERNLIRNYIYGDTKGFEVSDLPVTGLDKYINRYGPLKKYKLDASTIGEDAYPIENLMSQLTDSEKSSYANEFLSINSFDDRVNRLKDILKREGTISIGSEYSGIGADDIAGHMKFLSYDPATDAYNVRTQDIWKFTPEDYNKKWGLNAINRDAIKMPSFDLRTYLNNYMKSKQASLMDKAGKPFILLDERPISMSQAPAKERYGLDIKPSDYTVGELEEMGLTPSEITDVLWGKQLDAEKKIKDFDFSSFINQPAQSKQSLRIPFRKQGGPIVNQRGFMDGAPPKGSNWRIMGDGRGTSITMDLPNMPDEILVVPDGDFDKAKVMKQGQEEYFMGADFVDEYLLGQGGTTGPKIAVRDYPTMKSGGLSANKAREILHDKEVHGRPLTEKQRKFFGVIAGGNKLYKAQMGTMLTALPSNWGDRLSDVLSFPQKAITKLFTGEYQTPSEAMGIKNKVGAFATDVILDPINLFLGAGSAKASGALDKVYKINPWRFKPNPEAYYRGIGKTGLDDALETGLLRSKDAKQWGQKVHTTSQLRIAKQYSKNRPPLKFVDDGTGMGFKVERGEFPTGIDGKSYIAEIPRKNLINPNDPALYGNTNFHQFINPEPIPINNVKFYTEDWLRGYKQVKPLKKKQYGGGYGVFGYVPNRQLGGNALAMLRDYGGGISVPPKYQDGDEVNTAVNFIGQWTNSPMGRQMLYNSITKSNPIGSIEEAERVKKNRDSLLYNLKFYEHPTKDISDRYSNYKKLADYAPRLNYGPTLSPAKGLIRFGKNDDSYEKMQTLVHEVSHASDLAGRLIPFTDIAMMDKYARYPRLKTSPFTDDEKYQQYVANPTETRARLNSIRKTAKTFSFYNPFTEKAPSNLLKKFETNLNPNLSRPIEELRTIYTDDQIIDMLNSISMNSNEDIPQAKKGGLLNKTITCPNCGHSWKAIDGATDPFTCHKCGGMVKMKSGGYFRF